MELRMCNGRTTNPYISVFLDDLTLYPESSRQIWNNYTERRSNEPIHYRITEDGLCTQDTVRGIACTMSLRSLL